MPFPIYMIHTPRTCLESAEAALKEINVCDALMMTEFDGAEVLDSMLKAQQPV